MLFLVGVDEPLIHSGLVCDVDAEALWRVVGTGGIEVFKGAIPCALVDVAFRTERYRENLEGGGPCPPTPV